jgi:hypothetical protein
LRHKYLPKRSADIVYSQPAGWPSDFPPGQSSQQPSPSIDKPKRRRHYFGNISNQEFKAMSKVLSLLLIITAAFAVALAQEPNRSPDEPTSQGIAPKEPNGIGRADVRVFDENGNAIKNAYVKLESTRTDGFFCESWGDTDTHGMIALPPIHMGALKLKVKAKGFQSQQLVVPASDLANPVRVTLKKK